MDRLTFYRNAIESILNEHSAIPYAYGDVDSQVVYDHDRNRYLMLAIGWDGPKRVHGCVVDVQIIDDKIWIHQDGTEDGIATELEEKGITANEIVLAFHPPKIRPHTGYAVA